MGTKQLSMVQRSQLPDKGYPQWDGIPTFFYFCLFASQTPSLVAAFLCVCLVPSCAEAPPSTIRQWSSPQITDSMCLQETCPVIGGWAGRREGGVSFMPNTHAVLLPTAIVFPARLLQLQGKLPEPTEQLPAQTTQLQGPKPSYGSVPQPVCSHTLSTSHRCCLANQRPGCRSQQASKGEAVKEEGGTAI